MEGFLEFMLYLLTFILLVILLLSIMFYDFSFEGIVVDKFITSSKYGSPCFYIVVDKGGDTVTRKISDYDYYYGYFIGYSYKFNY